MRCKNTNAQNLETETSIDKGYFGIVVFFIQSAVVMKVQLEVESSSSSDKNSLDKLHSKISDFLNIDLSQVSYSICPLVNLDTTGKMIYQFIFLCGIYFCWFISVSLIHICQQALKRESLLVLKSKFISGFIEIVKYTYSGFAQITFLSLTCIKLASSYVWKLDGTVKCLSSWQIIALIFMLTYTIPFFAFMSSGITLLKKREIKTQLFLVGCVFPLPFLLWNVGREIKMRFAYSKIKKINVSQFEGKSPNRIEDYKKKSNDLSSIDDVDSHGSAILQVLQGPYKKEASTWEAVIILRRLSLSVTSLISNIFIQMLLNSLLCIFFFGHHLVVKPFVFSGSNRIESLSLSLLLIAAIINLSKSSFIELGLMPTGPFIDIFNILEVFENAVLFVLVGFIIFIEIRFKLSARPKGS